MAYPCTIIAIHENIVVTVHGPYISTFSLESGTLLQSTVPAISPSRQTISAKSFIMNVAVTLPRRRLVSVDHEKSLKVWDIDTLEILSTRELPKKAHQVLLTDDGATILVADKFGDVFAYPLVAPEIPPAERKDPGKRHDGRKSLASHSNPSLGILVLGHTSSLTRMLLTPNDEFLITADRDEHIRVSQYPKGYNIERFCMGHTKYVSALHLPQHLPGTLISAGGDRDLFLWDYQSGQLKDQLAIRETVYSVTKVQSQRRKFKRLETKAGTGWRARKRREREMKEEKARREQENKQKASPQATGVLDEDEEMIPANDDPHSPMKVSSPVELHGTLEESDRMITEDPSIDLPGGMAVGAARARLPAVEDVIVISRIATLRFESQYALVFSAVGANAIFFASFDGTKRWGPEEYVHQYNLPYPVLGFDVEPVAPGPSPASSSPLNRIWVTLDSAFVEQGTGTDAADQKEQSETNSITEVGESKANLANSIYLLEWRGGGTMIEVTVDSAPLLRTLRSLPVIPASKADILALDLYGLLTSLPKTEELEEPDGAEREEQDFSMETSGKASSAKEEGMKAIGATGGGAAGKESQQSREVKKSGRKKWQDKMESRQQQAQSQVGSLPKSEPSNGRTNSKVAEATMIGLEVEHVKAAAVPLKVVGKARKAVDLEDAGNSEGPATKKLRTDGS